mgnify:CR=1 FL=1
MVKQTESPAISIRWTLDADASGNKRRPPSKADDLEADHASQPTDRAPSPLLWFLPRPQRMRGGAARHFASDWLFHRGIHLESTPADLPEFSTRYQILTRHRLWLSGIHRGSHLASFGNPPLPKKPPAEATRTAGTRPRNWNPQNALIPRRKMD